MEPQFNPASEAQAIDRIHRLGQKRQVVCVRYIMEDSFEEKIVKLQNKKNDLANMTLSAKKLTKGQALEQRLEVSNLLLPNTVFPTDATTESAESF